jgi:hypothetical protein
LSFLEVLLVLDILRKGEEERDGPAGKKIKKIRGGGRTVWRGDQQLAFFQNGQEKEMKMERRGEGRRKNHTFGSLAVRSGAGSDDQ